VLSHSAKHVTFSGDLFYASKTSVLFFVSVYTANSDEAFQMSCRGSLFFFDTIYLSIDYYGDGQHALHVTEATIEDDNGTFTCLALNAAGRVQITADVFVHEKGNTLVLFSSLSYVERNKKENIYQRSI
jgi:hypothetical protein